MFARPVHNTECSCVENLVADTTVKVVEKGLTFAAPIFNNEKIKVCLREGGEKEIA